MALLSLILGVFLSATIVDVPTAAVAAAPKAKPGCPDMCGNVSIPFPFGIGQNCYFNSTYEVTCTNNVTRLSSIKVGNLGVEVRDIFIDGYIYIRGPKLPPKCSGDCQVKLNLSHGSSFWDPTLHAHKEEQDRGRLVLLYWEPPGSEAATLQAMGNKDDSFFCTYDSASDEKRVFYCDCRGGYDGNPYLRLAGLTGCEDTYECTDTSEDHCPGRWSKCKNTRGSCRCLNMRLFIVIGGFSSFIGLSFLIILARVSYKVMRKGKEVKLREKLFKQILVEQQSLNPDSAGRPTKLFKLKELARATDCFNDNRILGRGGQGIVYKGTLENGKIVAVKRTKFVDEKNVKRVINEVVILSQINHRNVVRLLGCCLETEAPLLVYEFVLNGTLFEHIHEQTEEFPLSWEVRLSIAAEVAGGLAYLHSSALVRIYHRDIKSTNILLDDMYRAKISDFGTSKYVSLDQTHLTTACIGTFGYLDPEYFQSSHFTEKSDVYSFGVVLIELLTSLKQILSVDVQGTVSLAGYFLQQLKENHLFDILDERVLIEGGRDDIITVANIAKRCLHPAGKERPTMREVAAELEGVRMSQGSLIKHVQREDVYGETQSSEVETWEATSFMTESHIVYQTASSLDVKPLVFHNTL